MFFAANWIRDYSSNFNRNYRNQNMKLETDLLISYMKKIHKIGLTDVLYWQDTDIDFQVICGQIDAIKQAAEACDYVYIYDKLNGELRKIVNDISETLFNKSAEELKECFWKINCDALQKRYPEVLQKLKAIHSEENGECIRPYGLRGRVVYTENGKEESDLFSACNPNDVGIRTAEKLEIGRYSKTYVWGYNGGFEISELLMPDRQGADVEIYVTDLRLFERILSNVHRSWLLVVENVSWKFEVSMDEFLNRIDLRDSNDIYILVGERYGNDLGKLKAFIDRNSINSNIESFLYKKEEPLYG